MSISFIFWLLMFLRFLNLLVGRFMPDRAPWYPIVNDVFLFILFFLLGWAEFGFAIHR
jgi:hypothetical protein